MTDLRYELERPGMQLDGPSSVPGREEPSAPGQRGGVRRVRCAEHRLVAGGAGGELVGVAIPQALPGSLNRPRLPSEATRGRSPGPRFERQTTNRSPVEDPVRHWRASLGAGEHHVSADVVRP